MIEIMKRAKKCLLGSLLKRKAVRDKHEWKIIIDDSQNAVSEVQSITVLDRNELQALQVMSIVHNDQQRLILYCLSIAKDTSACNDYRRSLQFESRVEISNQQLPMMPNSLPCQIFKNRKQLIMKFNTNIHDILRASHFQMQTIAELSAIFACKYLKLSIILKQNKNIEQKQY